MKQEHQDLVLQACGASSLRVGANIQTLWSGYGKIIRLHLEGCERPSVVVKHVKFPEEAEHPGGWNTDRSHGRKVTSYQVETHWYQNYSTNQSCRTPACLAACSHGDEMLIILEDLDAAGYDQRRYDHKKHFVGAEKGILFCLQYIQPEWTAASAQIIGPDPFDKQPESLWNVYITYLAFINSR